ncbi:MAG: electron transport complex subunit RsxB [Gammaproteobacteria bacterium]
MIDEINALLPQTQCGQCGFKGCRPYAEALAAGSADINQCPPGGEVGIRTLADFLGVAPKPLNPRYGQHKPKAAAFIIEEDCIGCVKCIQACPVDAIVGAAKLMHTVIASECTGCELCLEPCPMDCIVMKPLPLADASPGFSASLKYAQSALAKHRYDCRTQRKEKEEADKLKQAREKKLALLAKLKKDHAEI